MSYTQYQQYGGNPYDNGPDAESGGIGGPAYGSQNTQSHGQTNLSNQPYSQHGQQGHELSTTTSAYSQQPGASAPPSHTNILSQQDFLSRVDYVKSEIRSLTTNIHDIAALHQRSLSSTDTRASAELENLVTQTQLKNTAIKDQIKYLELDAAKSQGSTVKSRQATQLKGEFDKALKDYQQEEVGYRQRYREQIARQYRIVNPEASEQEVQEASELDWGSEGVFQTALKSNRTGQATSVLGAVRARHNELQRIESTLNDLAALFADMAQIVEAQDPVIEHTEQNAIKTVEDMDRGNTELDKSNEHARRRRKLKWYCLLVVVLIVIAIALGVGLGIGLTKKATSTATGA